jgi:hypothetical protein
MGYPKSEMLKKFQHDSDIAKGSIFDYGLWVELCNASESVKKSGESVERESIFHIFSLSRGYLIEKRCPLSSPRETAKGGIHKLV